MNSGDVLVSVGVCRLVPGVCRLVPGVCRLVSGDWLSGDRGTAIFGGFWNPFFEARGREDLLVYLAFRVFIRLPDPLSDYFWTPKMSVFPGALKPEYRFSRTKIPRLIL